MRNREEVRVEGPDCRERFGVSTSTRKAETTRHGRRDRALERREVAFGALRMSHTCRLDVSHTAKGHRLRDVEAEA